MLPRICGVSAQHVKVMKTVHCQLPMQEFCRVQHHPCSWRCTERARLPVHATGDYWPGESESLLANMGETSAAALCMGPWGWLRNLFWAGQSMLQHFYCVGDEVSARHLVCTRQLAGPWCPCDAR